MSPGSGPGPRTWRTPLRQVLCFGLPLAGIVVIGRAMVASIGGRIEPAQFALGLLLVVLSVSARPVRGR